MALSCWADTLTHAEWYVEVVDTYCHTLMLASQLGTPVTHFGEDKAGDLLATKQKLGLPDERLGMKECQLCDLPDQPGGIAIRAARVRCPRSRRRHRKSKALCRR